MPTVIGVEKVPNAPKENGAGIKTNFNGDGKNLNIDEKTPSDGETIRVKSVIPSMKVAGDVSISSADFGSVSEADVDNDNNREAFNTYVVMGNEESPTTKKN